MVNVVQANQLPSLKRSASLHLKMDGRNTIVSFCVRFREGMLCYFSDPYCYCNGPPLPTFFGSI